MGEERGSRSGKSFGNRGHFSRQNGGKNGGNGERRGGFHKGGFHKDGEHRGGFHKDGFKKNGFKKNSDRKFDGDSERRFDRDNRRFDRKDNREDRYNREDKRNRDNRYSHSDYDKRTNRGFESDSKESGNPRYKKFDKYNRDNRDNRSERGDRRFDRSERNDRRFEDNRGGFHKDGFHKGGFKKNDSRKRDSKSSFRFENGSRRNSDGTVSYPSQNPYTDRRPGEPKMPKGLEYSMLSKESRERLRGLSKEHSENIGLHILAAYALQDEDPELALEHAKWAAKQASRIDFSRETLGFIAYRQGDYKLAAREFRTAMRMNGYTDYLPFIADCERGMGNLDKALEICMSDEAKSVSGEVKAEMFLVYAGVLADTNHADKAIELVHAMGRSKGLPGEYRMRAVQAEQYFLEEAGRSDEAIELDSLLDRLEEQYADIEDEENPEDVVIDYDLEHLNDAIMDEVGISEDDAQFAPDDDFDDDSEDDFDDDFDDDSDDSDDSDEDSDDSQIADNTETVEMSAVKPKEE